MDKRTFLKILAMGTAGASALPLLLQNAQADAVKQATHARRVLFSS